MIVEISRPGHLHNQCLRPLTSDADGRFAVAVALGYEASSLDVRKSGYLEFTQDATTAPDQEIRLRRSLDWDEIRKVRWLGGAKLEELLREVFVSENRTDTESGVYSLFFEEHSRLRLTLRRLVHDRRVGWAARDWLDLMGDPADDDLFPKGRESAPKYRIAEDDLVEALRAICRRVNHFNNEPEPRIAIDYIALNPPMDRALIECGVNMAPFTGSRWRFVFVKVDKRWVLRSMQEAGRG